MKNSPVQTEGIRSHFGKNAGLKFELKKKYTKYSDKLHVISLEVKWFLAVLN